MNAYAARFRRLPRWLRLTVIALAVAWLVYLLLGNLFINTPIGHRVANMKPEKFRMDWSGGITLWPGRVTVWNVDMAGHVRRTTWVVRAERASGRIALLPLLRKEVRVPWVEAGGVSGGVDRAEVELPRPEPRPGGWTLHFDRIASDSIVGGSFFGDWTVEGEGVAQVGFRKQMRGGPMTLFPSSAGFSGATVVHDGQPLAQDARIGATFSMDEHRSIDFPGLARLDVLDASLDLQATTRLLQATLDADGRYRFAMLPGEGRLQGGLALRHGRLEPGGQLDLHMPLVAIDPRGGRHENALDLRLAVDEDIHLKIDVPESAHDDALMIDADLRIAGNRLPLRDWRERLAGASGRLKGHWHFPSLGWVAGLFAQAQWLDLQGRGAVEVDLAIASGRLAAGSRLRVPEVAASLDVLGSRFRGQAHAQGTIEHDDAGALRSRLELTMDAFDIAPDDDPDGPYVTGTDLRLNLAADADMARMRESATAHLYFTDASVPDLRAYNRYLPDRQIRFLGGSGRVSGDLRMDGGGEVGDGRFRVDARRARIAFVDLDMLGDVAIDTRLRRADLKEKTFEVGGSAVRLRNVGFTGRNGDARSGWWADVNIASGQADWDRPVRLRAQVAADVKDVDFLLALFATRADYPGWIGRLVDSGQAHVTGLVQWRDDTFVLDRGQAHNDRFHVNARLKQQGQRRNGDLYARWGVLGVGVELDGDTRRFHLRNPREWYEARPHLLH